MAADGRQDGRVVALLQTQAAGVVADLDRRLGLRLAQVERLAFDSDDLPAAG